MLPVWRFQHFLLLFQTLKKWFGVAIGTRCKELKQLSDAFKQCNFVALISMPNTALFNDTHPEWHNIIGNQEEKQVEIWDDIKKNRWLTLCQVGGQGVKILPKTNEHLVQGNKKDQRETVAETFILTIGGNIYLRLSDNIPVHNRERLWRWSKSVNRILWKSCGNLCSKEGLHNQLKWTNTVFKSSVKRKGININYGH